MHCPFCGHPETRVIDSRLASEGVQVRRRRECERCTERFTTFESAQLAMPAIVKRDDRRQPFDEDKLRRGIRRALEKRPVSDEQVEAAVDRISRGLRATGEREVPSRRVSGIMSGDGVFAILEGEFYYSAMCARASSIDARRL